MPQGAVHGRPSSATSVRPRILILGAAGMLGFALHRIFHDAGLDVAGSLRSLHSPVHPACANLNYVPGVDVSDFNRVEDLLDTFRPDAVINAVAVKRASGEAATLRLFETNAGFPKRLAHAASVRGVHLLHFSTDAVFDGVTGGYDEASPPNPQSPYALSKLLGEQTGHGALTIRTSMIGRGLQGGEGLMDWLLDQHGSTVAGHSASLFTGLPVDEIARFLLTWMLSAKPLPEGIYHLAAEPIDKHALIDGILREWDVKDIRLERQEGVRINRSLTTRRAAEFGDYRARAWPALIANMHSFYSTLGLA
jgi:dTDP-4-dehydrorhamnose reductase